MKNPCTPDCKERSPKCHATCERYLPFQEERMKESRRKETESKGKYYKDRKAMARGKTTHDIFRKSQEKPSV